MKTNTTKGNILIVDDNKQNIQILAQTLNDKGYEIECIPDSVVFHVGESVGECQCQLCDGVSACLSDVVA